MGCNVSRLDSQDPTFLSRIRPLFLHPFGEIKARRNLGSPLKDSSPSKKELLSNFDDENGHSPDPSKSKADSLEGKEEAPNNNSNATRVGDIDNEYSPDLKKENVVKDGGSMGLVKINTKEGGTRVEDDHFADAVDELRDDDNDDDDRNKRMIGYGGGEAFPGSPSFRVYFKDNEMDGLDFVIGKKDTFKETYKEPSAKEKLERSKKKRSFRYVLPKNLLSMKSCYTPSHNSSHNNPHRLPAGKTTT